MAERVAPSRARKSNKQRWTSFAMVPPSIEVSLKQRVTETTRH
jgi:hypothetical protein